MLSLLAQTAADADKTISVLERLTKGGVPLICLAIAVAACVLAYWQMKLRMDSEREKTELEKQYRQNIEDRAKQDKADAEKRLTDAKQDAKDRAVETDKLMRERMGIEKESDATLAQAVAMIEADEKALSSGRDALAKNTAVLDRIERLLTERRA
jgi:hypothetical protein